jgi:hypothetical protein
MGLLAPWVLGALAAAALPLIAHLARAQPREGRGFPSLMFLKRVPFPSRARRRLRDRPLLVLRLLALLVLVLAFAGPYALYEGAVDPRRTRDTVVLLDVSYSMDVPGLFEAARERAAASVDAAARAGRVAVVAFDSAPRVLSGLTEGAAAARAAVSAARPDAGATNLARALEAGERLLALGEAVERRLVLVTDLQAAGVVRELRLREDIDLDVEAVGLPRPGNLALTAAWIEAAGGPDPGRTVLRARVENTGGKPAASDLRVVVDGLPADRVALSLAPGEARELPLPLYPADDRPTRVELSLSGSGVAADDRLFRVIAPRRPIAALLVQEPSSPTPHLAAALALARDPAVRLRTLAPDATQATDVGAADVLILDGTGPTSPAAIAAVRARVEAGGGVLAFAGEGELRLPQGLLPAPAEVVAPGPGGAPFGRLAPGHPLAGAAVDAFSDGAALTAVTAWRYRRVTPAAGDEVLARFAGGAPGLIARTAGSGRALLLATSPAPGWSTLALEPVFVPLLHESLAWLAGRPVPPPALSPGGALDPAAYAAAVAGGEALDAALREGVALLLRAPDGSERRLAPGASVAPRAPGFHELRVGDALPLPVAVSVDTRESRFDALDPEAFRAGLRRTPAPVLEGRTVVAAAEPDLALAWGLLALAAALLSLESMLAGRLTRRRARAAGQEAHA